MVANNSRKSSKKRQRGKKKAKADARGYIHIVRSCTDTSVVKKPAGYRRVNGVLEQRRNTIDHFSYAFEETVRFFEPD